MLVCMCLRPLLLVCCLLLSLRALSSREIYEEIEQGGDMQILTLSQLPQWQALSNMFAATKNPANATDPLLPLGGHR